MNDESFLNEKVSITQDGCVCRYESTTIVYNQYADVTLYIISHLVYLHYCCKQK